MAAEDASAEHDKMYEDDIVRKGYPRCDICRADDHSTTDHYMDAEHHKSHYTHHYLGKQPTPHACGGPYCLYCFNHTDDSPLSAGDSSTVLSSVSEVKIESDSTIEAEETHTSIHIPTTLSVAGPSKTYAGALNNAGDLHTSIFHGSGSSRADRCTSRQKKQDSARVQSRNGATQGRKEQKEQVNHLRRST